MRASIDFDVVVAGAGVVGATTALLLARAGLHVAVVDRPSPRPDAGDGARDGRTLAITRAGERILTVAGVRAGIPRHGRFAAMEVWDGRGSGRIRFEAAAICAPHLGIIVEQGVMQSALAAALAAEPRVRMVPGTVGTATEAANQIRVLLDDGRSLAASMLVAADGPGSSIRSAAGIAVRERDYDMSAITAVVRTERPHEDVARQVFLDEGPLAFLPLDDPKLCAIVWSLSTTTAGVLLAAEDAAFATSLAEAFGTTLGPITEVGVRRAHPLVRRHAERYVSGRVVLVGDSAHVIHPLAGQGANLGLLDAAALAEVAGEAWARGRDPGGLSTLRRYERWRRGENLLVQSTMDAFLWLFEGASGPRAAVRNLGLTLCDRSPAFKAMVMRRAMGDAGDLPRVARPQVVTEAAATEASGG